MKRMLTTTSATAALTAAAVALTAPAVAHAAADPSCEGLSDNLRKLCEIGNSPAPTNTGGGGPEWMQGLPDLSIPIGIGAALIVMGAIIVITHRDKASTSRTLRPGTARAGAYSAGQREERAIGAVMAAVGAVVLGWGLGGLGGALIAAVVAVPVALIAGRAGERAEQAQRGYEQADAAWRQDVEMAKLNAQLHRPNPAEFDPLGLGISPPPAPAPVLPAEPMMTDEDALRYARMGGHVELIPGSAAASLVARDGSWTAAESAWIEACKAARLGGAEMRQSRIPGVNGVSEVFVPGADLVRVEVLEDGDAAVVVRPRSLAVGATELAAATPFLLRTARVRHAGAWVRAHSTDEFVIVLSNRDLAAAPEQTSGPAPVDDDDEWV
ncbi:hypothetical protein G9444_0759 [Rhodococcus erythropolis]|uniref:Uncharacterized protein n=1 Tax=Rhodococcus erythropolis TaxID=1833 RepID=A0A6G9CLT7_RHOER|nr:hypothetical protein [Rhodococcus erythropolis]QIP38003.1 hypothetical protein G9444_0759 [Rhodococcus erythropolis]